MCGVVLCWVRCCPPERGLTCFFLLDGTTNRQTARPLHRALIHSSGRCWHRSPTDRLTDKLLCKYSSSCTYLHRYLIFLLSLHWSSPLYLLPARRTTRGRRACAPGTLLFTGPESSSCPLPGRRHRSRKRNQSKSRAARKSHTTRRRRRSTTLLLETWRKLSTRTSRLLPQRERWRWRGRARSKPSRVVVHSEWRACLTAGGECPAPWRPAVDIFLDRGIVRDGIGVGGTHPSRWRIRSISWRVGGGAGVEYFARPPEG